jgi:AraC-like DNA-binding protein
MHPFDALQTLDLALRGGVIGCVLLLAGLMLRSHRRAPVARLGLLLALGLSAYLLNTLPGWALVPRPVWAAPLLALGVGNSVVFWLFCRALFDDACAWHAGHVGAWVGMVALGLLNCYWLGPAGLPAAGWAGAALDGLPLLFALLALGAALSTWRSDLVERRRRLRWFIVLGGLAYTVLQLIGRLTLARSAHAATSTLDVALLAVLVVSVAWRLLGVPPSDLFGGTVTQTGGERASAPREPTGDAAPIGTAPAEPAATLAESAAERMLAADLQRRMADEQLYREDSLTIGSLAARIGLPEYRLRRVINQHLGYRNFNAFLNRWRIDQARRALADPALAQRTVLTIALDAGFQSIGPFNRAFKADTGLTPSEFRRNPPVQRGQVLADS